jgi:hypothetical protein
VQRPHSLHRTHGIRQRLGALREKNQVITAPGDSVEVSRTRSIFVLLPFMAGWAALCALGAQALPKTIYVAGQGLRCGVDAATGLPVWIESSGPQGQRVWLRDPVHIAVRNEVSELTAYPKVVKVAGGQSQIDVAATVGPLQLTLAEHWKGTSSGLDWNLTFSGSGERAGHEVTIDLPVLSRDLQIFTPSNDGITDLAKHPTYRPVPYAHIGWNTAQAYVLPLVTVIDAARDSALTVALPPDRNIPHLQVEWINARILRLTLAHRAMGGNKTSALRLLFYAHPADYRSTLKVYSDDFPAYFKPVIRRPQNDGSFYYHHIQSHPDFGEMARQNVRYLWSSFWFTHLGDYLPGQKEWFPYTYASWWKLGQTMNDGKINAFIGDMRAHGISVFAYFNVTEYGGAGDKGGNSQVSDRVLKEQFADALVKDAQNRPIPSWEGAYVMNPGARYSLWPRLEEQVRRHLDRLPGIEGFAIDRLDWSSRYDYGHSDEFTMVADRPLTNLAEPVGEAVQQVCRMAHERGKQVLVNVFYRIEVLRDVDGYCQENDYLPALGYLSPFRQAAAWNMRQPYEGDLFRFEGQLKQRLQFALMPHMVAHEFPISQQKPSVAAADVLELYAPLFATLAGKEQVLLPHCVEVTGDNDVNLFVNGAQHYVVPVTSRVRFRSRGANLAEPVEVTLRVPDAPQLRWAHVVSADGPPYRGTLVSGPKGTALLRAQRHGTATMIIAGKDTEPPLTARW